MRAATIVSVLVIIALAAAWQLSTKTSESSTRAADTSLPDKRPGDPGTSSPEPTEQTDRRYPAADTAEPSEDYHQRLLSDPAAAHRAFINGDSKLSSLGADQVESLARVAAMEFNIQGHLSSRQKLVDRHAQMPPLENYLAAYNKTLSPHELEVINNIWATRKSRVESLAEEIFDRSVEHALFQWEEGKVLFWNKNDTKPPQGPPQPEGRHLNWESSGGIGDFLYHFRFTSADYPALDAQYAELHAEKKAALEEIRNYIEKL